MRGLGASKKIVGLDISRNGIHGVISQHSAHRVIGLDSFFIDVQITDMLESELSEKVATKLKEVVDQYRLRNQSVVFAVPNPHVIVRYLQMPEVPFPLLRQAMEVEIGTTIHLPLDEPSISVDCVPRISAPEAGNPMMGVSLIATSMPVVTRLSSLMKRVGLIPLAADIKPLALLRGAGIDPASSSELVLVAQLEDDEMTFAIFIGPHLYFFRNMDVGIRAEMISSEEIRTSITDIVFEINRVINFFNFNLCEFERPVGKMYLHTNHSKPELIIQEIAEQLSLPVAPLNAGPLWTGEEKLDAAFVGALGLSAKRGALR